MSIQVEKVSLENLHKALNKDLIAYDGYGDVFLVNEKFYQPKIYNINEGRLLATGGYHSDKRSAALEAIQLRGKLKAFHRIRFERKIRDYKQEVKERKEANEKLKADQKAYLENNTHVINDDVTLYGNLFNFSAKFIKEHAKKVVRLDEVQNKDLASNIVWYSAGKMQVSLPYKGKIYKSNIIGTHRAHMVAYHAIKLMREYLQGVLDNGSEQIQSREY